MKKNLHAFLLTLLLTLSWSPVHAYELATHGRMTYEAFKRSALNPNPNDPNDPQFLKKVLGIENGVNPFGSAYYDISGTTVSERTWQLFEQDKDRMPQGTEPLSVEGWLMRGAIREDDYARAFGVWIAPNPENDPDQPQAFWRVMNHFYDPVNNAPLTLSAAQAGAFSLATGDSTDFRRAPDWATGAQDAFAPSPVPEEGRRNHFTVLDAREAMYRALTGKNKNGDDVAATKDDRNKYWATLFRALGDIVHLVQDMGQPQHTRNDMHSGVLGFGHASVYEAYLDCRATGGQFEYIDNYQDNYIDSCYSLTYDGHPTPVFTRYADYFATRDGTGRGLAEYSNRNFFTFGTNLGSNNYSSPSNNRSVYDEEPFLQFDTFGFQRTVKFLRGNVTDTRTGETNNIRLTTESAFDYFLGTSRSYSINAYNYDAMADLLIPRAVAYSAGFMDHFFRGRVKAEEVTFVDEAITLKVKNAIDVKKFPDYANEKLYNGGKLMVTREYKVGDEKRLDATDAVLLEEDIEPGKVTERSYTFIFRTTLPQGVVSIKFRLVYRGKLGEEEDAVVAAEIKPLSGFVVTPNYIPTDGLGGSRHIYRYANRWMLSEETGLVAGNIDWKGWYVNGKPTRTLTWYGPTARYFPNWGADTSGDGSFTPEIYQDGELYAVAPRAVLGAALMKDANNVEWLLAIGKEGYTDVVYRRPSKKSDSAVLYDPVSNPDGWKEIGRFTRDQATYWEADRPWFFNGDGTEARTMRRGYKYLGPDIGNQQWLYELVIAVGDTASEGSGGENQAIHNPWTESKTCQTESFSDPDSVCVGNCEGVQTSRGSNKETYTEAGLSAGEIAVAVDYDVTGPVYAKYSVRDNSTSTFSNETSSENSTVCGRDSYGGLNYCSSPSNYSLSVSTRTVVYSPGYSEIISIASGTIETKLWSRSGTRHTVYSSRSETIGDSTTGTQSVEATSNLVKTWGFIQYMDLRTNIMSVFTQIVSEQGTGNADPESTQYGTLIPVLISARSEQKLYHPDGVTLIHEIPPDNVNTLINQVSPRTYVELLGRNLDVVKTENDVSYVGVGIQNNPEIACGQSRSHDSVAQEEIYSPPNNVGYWAADGGGNLLVSAVAKNYSPYRNMNKYFSYLTSGSLGPLIPVAPENPWYYNVGVLH